jgi:predicted outer membrane repeat protein
LYLEQLEDRTLPSAVALIVTSTGNTVDPTLPVAGASRIVVDTLPTAIAFADAHPRDTYTVTFAPGIAGTINLGTGSGTLSLDASITINGPVSGGITIEGGSTPNSTNNVQVFFIEPGVHAALNDLTIANGNQPTTDVDPGGGNIYNAGTLSLRDDIFLGGNANYGAAIFNAGDAVAFNSIFVGGTAYRGAGVFNTGTFLMKDVVFIGNQASAGGGALFNTNTGLTGAVTAGTMTIKGSVFLQNSAADGGAIENFGTMTLKNDAFIENHALVGGAIFEDGHLTLEHVRFIGDTASVAGNDIFVPGP